MVELSNSVKIWLFILIFILNKNSFAQIYIPNYTDPDPLNELFSSLESQKVEGIKRIVRININKDTVAIYKYNRVGDISELIMFEYNKINLKSIYEYPKNKNFTQFKTYNTKGELKGFCKMFTDKNGNCFKEEYLGSTNKIENKFKEFDKYNNCIKEYTGNKTDTSYFYFPKNKPLKAKTGNFKVNWIYDEELNLIERVDSLFNDRNYVTKYEYLNDKIVSRTINKKTQIYTYQDDKLIAVKFLNEDNSYTNAFLNYTNFGKLESVVLRGNTLSIPYHFMFSSKTDYYRIKNGVELKIEFYYDSHNNLIEKKYFVDNQYRNSFTFINEYY